MANRSGPVGILNVNKPLGMTSRRAVDRVCRLLGTRKVGHCGTLDSLASGVLVVCVGRPATKHVETIQRLPKTYRTVLRLGATSPSHDLDTPVAPSPACYEPPRRVLERLLAQFVGTFPQRVPDYSAAQHKGQRLHRLARAGQAVPPKVKLVTVHGIDLVDYAYPAVTLEIRCGKGTYVRSIARDLGAAVGTGAVVEDLVRTAIGPFRLADAVDLAAATPESLHAALSALDAVLPSLGPEEVAQ